MSFPAVAMSPEAADVSTDWIEPRLSCHAICGTRSSMFSSAVARLAVAMAGA